MYDKTVNACTLAFFSYYVNCMLISCVYMCVMSSGVLFSVVPYSVQHQDISCSSSPLTAAAETGLLLVLQYMAICHCYLTSSFSKIMMIHLAFALHVNNLLLI